MGKILSWDEYFMSIAKLSAMRSKDPSTQVGACIVNEKKRIVGIGYNGFPSGCDEDSFPWDNDKGFLDSKYAYVVHAEVNAILNSNSSLDGCILYVSLFPCNECAKLIIQSGIKHIFFEEDRPECDWNIASKKLFNAAGVTYSKIDNTVSLTVDTLKN